MAKYRFTILLHVNMIEEIGNAVDNWQTINTALFRYRLWEFVENPTVKRG